MLRWDSITKRGRRASDRASAPAIPLRDFVLEAAIAHEQVELCFQPLISIADGRIGGVEALARSAVARSAEALFARAASAALGERLSRLVQRKALRSAAAWEGPLKLLRLSINLLPSEISREGYDRWLLEEVDAAGFDPSRLTLEITESALLAESDSTIAQLERLRSEGIAIAIDDFGTGYANLSYLTSLPLDRLKIDRSLVSGIERGKRGRIVVEAMVRLGQQLGLEVVAEGVETAGQLALLAGWGCDFYQGFLASPPLAHEALVNFVAANAALPAEESMRRPTPSSRPPLPPLPGREKAAAPR